MEKWQNQRSVLERWGDSSSCVLTGRRNFRHWYGLKGAERKSETVRLLVLDNRNLLHCAHQGDIYKGWNLRMITSVCSIQISLNLAPKDVLKGQTIVLNQIQLQVTQYKKIKMKKWSSPSWGKRIWLGSMRVWIWSLALLSGLRIWHCPELWCRSQTEARIWSCCGCGVGRQR